MNIFWKIDENGEVKPDDLLGEISLSDSDGSVIRDNCIYLESFFQALSSGLLKSKTQNTCAEKIFDSPFSLEFKRKKSDLEILYRGVKIQTNYDEAVKELCTSYEKLVSSLGGVKKVEEFKDLNNIVKSLCK